MSIENTTTALDATRRVIGAMAESAVENETYFSDLDAVVGDGDFGHSLARGFEAVLEILVTSSAEHPGALLTEVGLALTRNVGGTSGPIWGTAFLRAGALARDRDKLTGEDVVAMLRAAVQGIRDRGGASLGEKTLLDALIPAVETLEAEIGRGAGRDDSLAAAAASARAGADKTREMVARRGRASYTGERSRGSLDAGAVAIATMFERLANLPAPGK